MPIRYHCPHCSQLLSVGTRMAGYTLECPKCQLEHVVPSSGIDDAVAEIAAADAGPANELAEAAVESAAAPPAPVTPSPPPIAPTAQRTPPANDDEDDDALPIRGFQRESDEMDLTPMVDCVFLLLIFFMITASFTLQKTIEVPAPDPEKKGATQNIQTLDDLEKTSVIVQIDERNLIYVDDVPLADPAALADTLRDKMHSEQKTELVVEANGHAFHETVVAVVDAANDAQFQKIRLATTPGTEPD